MPNIIGIWSKEDLRRAKNPKTAEDRLISTIFMNRDTFSDEEIKGYPYHLRQTYLCLFPNGGEEPVTIYATDTASLKRFIEAHYTELPAQVLEQITTCKEVNL